VNVTVTFVSDVFAAAPPAGLVDLTSVCADAIVAPPRTSAVARIEMERKRCDRILG
jgi:hypothetical protein